MTRRAQLPPGCKSLAMEDGTTYNAARAGGHVDVSDHHARYINAMGGNGDAGLVSASGGHYIGTKTGRWCTNCQPARLWNVWSTQCPRCGAPTQAEP